MCVCGDMVQTTGWGADNMFVPHSDRRTKKPCPGIPQIPTAGFDVEMGDPPKAKKLFCLMDDGQVTVAIVPEAYYDFVKDHGEKQIRVTQQGHIRIPIADFEEWLTHTVEWLATEKAKLAKDQ